MNGTKNRLKSWEVCMKRITFIFLALLISSSTFIGFIFSDIQQVSAYSKGNEVSIASGTPAACQPYGPVPGYQYDPEKLMKKMGEPRHKHPGPFLSAHRAHGEQTQVFPGQLWRIQ